MRKADIVAHGALQEGEDPNWPVVANRVAEEVTEGRCQQGVLLCWTGTGVSIAANKVPGIRACVCHDTYTAHQGVEHDDMNVVCLGARVIGLDLSKDVISSFLGASFIPEPRFQRRLDKLNQVEAEG